MVLIQCPECANSISNQASSCPNCGFSFPPPRQNGWQSSSTGEKLFFIGAVILALLVMAALCAIIYLKL